MGGNIFPYLKQFTFQSMYHSHMFDLPETGKNILKITEVAFSRIVGHVAIYEAETSYSGKKCL